MYFSLPSAAHVTYGWSDGGDCARRACAVAGLLQSSLSNSACSGRCDPVRVARVRRFGRGCRGRGRGRRARCRTGRRLRGGRGGTGRRRRRAAFSARGMFMPLVEPVADGFATGALLEGFAPEAFALPLGAGVAPLLGEPVGLPVGAVVGVPAGCGTAVGSATSTARNCSLAACSTSLTVAGSGCPAGHDDLGVGAGALPRHLGLGDAAPVHALPDDVDRLVDRGGIDGRLAGDRLRGEDDLGTALEVQRQLRGPLRLVPVDAGGDDPVEHGDEPREHEQRANGAGSCGSCHG